MGGGRGVRARGVVGARGGGVRGGGGGWRGAGGECGSRGKRRGGVGGGGAAALTNAGKQFMSWGLMPCNKDCKLKR